MRFFEYRSESICIHNYGPRHLEEILDEWGKEGWEVLSVLVPDHRNYDTFRVTAKREILEKRTPVVGRKFR